MIEDKTRGNLSKEEKNLLGQSLTTLRMSFVEAMGKNPSDTAEPSRSSPDAPPEPAAEGIVSDPSGATPTAESEPESRKKFTKKY